MRSADQAHHMPPFLQGATTFDPYVYGISVPADNTANAEGGPAARRTLLVRCRHPLVVRARSHVTPEAVARTARGKDILNVLSGGWCASRVTLWDARCREGAAQTSHASQGEEQE